MVLPVPEQFESACWMWHRSAKGRCVGYRLAWSVVERSVVGRICFRCRGLPMVKSRQVNAVCWATYSSVPPRGRSRCDCTRSCGLRAVPAMRRRLDVVSICGTLRITDASQHRPFLQGASWRLAGGATSHVTGHAPNGACAAAGTASLCGPLS
jgi:hypothetical protein